MAGRDPRLPTRDQIAAAVAATVPDVLGPGLDVLFVGINPGLYSAAVGHHFARPGNRFWKALAGSGFTERVLSPFEDGSLPAYGLGITNLVGRATAAAADLPDDELRAGGRAVARKVRRHGPRAVAFLGIGAYRVAFSRREAAVGPVAGDRELGGAIVWVLPNPSGLNAHYRLADLVASFTDLREALR